MNKTLSFLFLIFNYIFLNGQTILFDDSQSKLEIISNTQYECFLKSNISQIDIKQVKLSDYQYNKITIAGYSASGEIGSPELMAISKIIEIPQNAELVISYNNIETTEISLNNYNNLKLIPKQPSISKSINPDSLKFYFNNEIYNSDFYLSKPTITYEIIGEMHGKRLAKINVNPIQYNPTKNSIIISKVIEAKIEYKNSDIEKTNALNNSHNSLYFNNINKINKIELLGTKVLNQNNPIKYIIVSDSIFKHALQPFIKWKTEKGYKVIELYTNNNNVGKTKDSIKTYLTNLYNSATETNPAATFLLLVGDVSFIPAFNGLTDSHYTDLYYAEYTGDYIPDVFYGRLSASDTNDLIIQINKIIQYEKYQFSNSDFLSNAVLVAGVDESFAPTYANGQVNYLNSTYFNSSNNYNNTYSYYHPGSGNAIGNIITNINNGVGFVNYTAHGSVYGWENPHFTVDNMYLLNNENKYPIIISNACKTGSYNYPKCLGEAFVQADKKGALAFIGASNNTFWDEDYWWSIGISDITVNPSYNTSELGVFDRLFHTHNEAPEEWFITLGQMLFAGNLSVSSSQSTDINYYWEIYNLLGDPSLMPYLSIPSNNDVSYSKKITPDQEFMLITASPYTLVAITKNDSIYGSGFTDKDGFLEIALNPLIDTGYCNIVFTAQNKIPIFDSIQIVSPNQSLINIISYNINDMSGNDNKKIDYDELIYVNINIKNSGNVKANDIKILLNNNSNYITLIDSVESITQLDSLESIVIDSAFAFKVDYFIENNYSLLSELNIKINNTEQNNLQYFYSTVNAPILDLIDCKLKNYEGRYVSNLSPNDTAYIHLKVKNNGNSEAKNVVCKLNSVLDNVTILTDSVIISNIPSDSVKTGVFKIFVKENAVIGEVLALKAIAYQKNYIDSTKLFLGIGSLIEDFETNNFSKFKWINESNNKWTTQQDTVCEGNYSARSGKIKDNGTSELSIDLHTVADTISFYYKTSSEDYADKLIFYVDNKLIYQWSGEQAFWTKAKHYVERGYHNFKWVYKKDYSISQFNDCVYLDSIIFPAIIDSSLTVNIKSYSESNKTINVYPNPADNIINIEYYSKDKTEPLDIYLLNSTGQVLSLLESKINENKIHLTKDISNLKSGIYYLYFYSKSYKTARKIIVY